MILTENQVRIYIRAILVENEVKNKKQALDSLVKSGVFPISKDKVIGAMFDIGTYFKDRKPIKLARKYGNIYSKIPDLAASASEGLRSEDSDENSRLKTHKVIEELTSAISTYFMYTQKQNPRKYKRYFSNQEKPASPEDILSGKANPTGSLTKLPSAIKTLRSYLKSLEKQAARNVKQAEDKKKAEEAKEAEAAKAAAKAAEEAAKKAELERKAKEEASNSSDNQQSLPKPSEAAMKEVGLTAKTLADLQKRLNGTTPYTGSKETSKYKIINNEDLKSEYLDPVGDEIGNLDIEVVQYDTSPGAVGKQYKLNIVSAGHPLYDAVLEDVEKWTEYSLAKSKS